MITKRLKKKKCPWITRKLKHAMNYCDTLQRKFRKSKNALDYENYKHQRNKVNILVRKEKSVHNQNLLNESANDPNLFWSTLKQIFPSKEIAPISMTFDFG